MSRGFSFGRQRSSAFLNSDLGGVSGSSSGSWGGIGRPWGLLGGQEAWEVEGFSRSLELQDASCAGHFIEFVFFILFLEVWILLTMHLLNFRVFSW